MHPVDPLSMTLSALADPTRRAILARFRARRSDGERAGGALRHQPARGLAAPEGARDRRADLARREAQWRPCRLEARPLKALGDWLERYRRFWEGSFDKMDVYLKQLKHQEEEAAMSARANPKPVAGHELLHHPHLRRAGLAGLPHLGDRRAHDPAGWAPPTSPAPTLELDFRPGGAWRACIESEVYGESWMGGRYPRDRARPADRLHVRLGGQPRAGRRRHARHRDLRGARREDGPDLPSSALRQARDS